MKDYIRDDFERLSPKEKQVANNERLLAGKGNTWDCYFTSDWCPEGTCRTCDNLHWLRKHGD